MTVTWPMLGVAVNVAGAVTRGAVVAGDAAARSSVSLAHPAARIVTVRRAMAPTAVV